MCFPRIFTRDDDSVAATVIMTPSIADWLTERDMNLATLPMGHRLARLTGLQGRPELNHHVVAYADSTFDQPEVGTRRAVRLLVQDCAVLSIKASSLVDILPAIVLRQPTLMPSVRQRWGGETLIRLHLSRLSVNDGATCLHTELIDSIISFLRLSPVDMCNVTCTGASSTSPDPVAGRCHPSNTLKVSHGAWWITENGTMTSGEGAEWIEYDFGTEACLLSFVHIAIPPMPSGPLSVRRFHLEAPDEDGHFVCVSPVFETLDAGTRQVFALNEPIVVGGGVPHQRVRVVCTMNAAAHHQHLHREQGAMDMDDWPIPSSIGFFNIGFS